MGRRSGALRTGRAPSRRLSGGRHRGVSTDARRILSTWNAEASRVRRCSGVGSFDVSGLDLWHPEGAETDEGADLDENVVPVDCGGPLKLLDFGLRTRVRRRVEVSPRTARRF